MDTPQKLSKTVVFVQQASGAFKNAHSDEAVRTLGSIKTKGSSYEKADITLDFHDEIHHINQGVSIKSFLGSSPTLLKAVNCTLSSIYSYV